jgi:hypothetical protein
MIELYQIELEFLKVFAIGAFIGWKIRKVLRPNKRPNWTHIKNIKYPELNKKGKI